MQKPYELLIELSFQLHYYCDQTWKSMFWLLAAAAAVAGSSANNDVLLIV